jgi:hypothetical protein
MPTFVFMQHSKEVDRFSGADLDQLVATISKYATVESFGGSGYTLSGTTSSTAGPGAAGGGGLASWFGLGGGPAPAGALPTLDASDEMNLRCENQAKEIFAVNNNSPVCKVQVRLADGSR